MFARRVDTEQLQASEAANDILVSDMKSVSEDVG
jgi:hypothetical protein